MIPQIRDAGKGHGTHLSPEAFHLNGLIIYRQSILASRIELIRGLLPAREAGDFDLLSPRKPSRLRLVL